MPAPNGYLEPFVLRRLALCAPTARCRTQADERFRSSGLDWHADQTEALIHFRNNSRVPCSWAERRIRLGASRTESYTQDMAVSRRTVTVLFADVADSTPLGERLDPETLRQVMSRWFERMSEVLVRHGGTVEKFIGDAVMAVFGIPELHEDDALRAVRAATELRAALAKLNDELESELGVHIGIRVGVNTGEVVAGTAPGGRCS